MAVLDAMPEQAIVDGFKGTLDFYYYLGVPVCRSWPRWTLSNRSPAVQAQWPRFAQAAALWSQLSPEMQEAYRRMAAGTDYTARDLFTREYIRQDGMYTDLTP